MQTMTLIHSIRMLELKFLLLQSLVSACRIIDRFPIRILVPIFCLILVPVYQIVDGVDVLHSVRVDGSPILRLYGLSLSACDRKCRCNDRSTHINYGRMRLVCELIMEPLERNKDVAGYVTSPASMPLYQDDCFINETVKACPELIPGPHMSVLGNMNVVGAKRVVTCVDGYDIEGTNVTTCTEEGIWSEHGQCVQISTIGGNCQSDADCVDLESECRMGQCWCKINLSHNPVTKSCISFCPGEYGTTFQSLVGYRIKNKNVDQKTTSSVEECMHYCVGYVSPGYVCIYVDWIPDNMMCYLNVLPEGTLPPLETAPSQIFLQRDCADSTSTQ